VATSATRPARRRRRKTPERYIVLTALTLNHDAEKLHQKSKNSQSGTEFARTKEDQAAIMRAKQAAGKS